MVFYCWKFLEQLLVAVFRGKVWKNLDLHLRWWGSLSIILRTVFIYSDFGHWPTISYVQRQKMIAYWIVSVSWELVCDWLCLADLGAAEWEEKFILHLLTRWAKTMFWSGCILMLISSSHVSMSNQTEQSSKYMCLCIYISVCIFSLLMTSGVHLKTALPL